MSDRERTPHDVSGQLVSGDYLIWELGNGTYFLDKLVDYEGYITIGAYESEDAAKAAADA